MSSGTKKLIAREGLIFLGFVGVCYLFSMLQAWSLNSGRSSGFRTSMFYRQDLAEVFKSLLMLYPVYAIVRFMLWAVRTLGGFRMVAKQVFWKLAPVFFWGFIVCLLGGLIIGVFVGITELIRWKFPDMRGMAPLRFSGLSTIGLTAIVGFYIRRALRRMKWSRKR